MPRQDLTRVRQTKKLWVCAQSLCQWPHVGVHRPIALWDISGACDQFAKPLRLDALEDAALVP